jgi:hypothetical protein
MILNVGGTTNGAANSQQKTHTGTVATTIRTGAWASGIMSPTTAEACRRGDDEIANTCRGS